MAVAGLLKDPFTCEPYEPQIVGQERKILLGKKSGLVSVSYKVKDLGLSVPEDRFPEILVQVKEAAVNKRRALTDDEFKAVTEAVLLQ
jgi:isopropylmalate/homocitrate/citramalate synthase